MTKGTISGRAPIAVQVQKDKDYWWCSCGLSKKQPFCDGAHKQAGKFLPLKWTPDESGEKWFCACKQTNSPPFCDGSHKSLPA